MTAGSAHSRCPLSLNANDPFYTQGAEKTLRAHPTHHLTNEETETPERSRWTRQCHVLQSGAPLFIVSPGYSCVTSVLQTHRSSCLLDVSRWWLISFCNFTCPSRTPDSTHPLRLVPPPVYPVSANCPVPRGQTPRSPVLSFCLWLPSPPVHQEVPWLYPQNTCWVWLLLTTVMTTTRPPSPQTWASATATCPSLSPHTCSLSLFST